MNKGDRLAAITLLLQSREKVTAAELSATFEVSLRTIYRDLEALSEAGLPLVSLPGRNGGYRLMEGFKLPPLTFTPEEGLALALGNHVLMATGEHPLSDAARRAWLKVTAALPPSVREGIAAMARSVGVSLLPSPARRVPREVFAAVLDGLWRQCQVEITYERPASGEVTERPVGFYGVFYASARWYGVGYCFLRRDLRSFRLDRVRRARVLPEGYTVPADFRLERWMETMFRVEYEGTLPGEAHFAAGCGNRLVDDPYFSRELQRLPDGSWRSRFLLHPDEIPWVTGLLLSYGPLARALSPPELCLSLHRAATDILRHYAGALPLQAG